MGGSSRRWSGRIGVGCVLVLGALAAACILQADIVLDFAETTLSQQDLDNLMTAVRELLCPIQMWNQTSATDLASNGSHTTDIYILDQPGNTTDGSMWAGELEEEGWVCATDPVSWSIVRWKLAR